MAPSGPPVTLRFALRTDSSATFAQRSRRADLCSAFLRRAKALLLAASSGTENRFSLANPPAARESLRVNPPVRIAMWSGPRNISTAMMRAWGNRRYTFVIDEPLYAYYLRATGRKHPGADEVIAAGEIDWRKVVALLTGPIPNSRQIFFQKQMTHHLLPEVDREWLGAVTNCFLIRDPIEVIASYIKKREDPVLEDLGFTQQAEIFDFVSAHTNSLPPIWMPKTFCKILNECYACCAMQSASSLVGRCFPGRRDCEKPTASGPGIGMLRWQRPPRFSPIVPEITK